MENARPEIVPESCPSLTSQQFSPEWWLGPGTLQSFQWLLIKSDIFTLYTPLLHWPPGHWPGRSQSLGDKLEILNSGCCNHHTARGPWMCLVDVSCVIPQFLYPSNWFPERRETLAGDIGRFYHNHQQKIITNFEMNFINVIFRPVSAWSCQTIFPPTWVIYGGCVRTMQI